MSTEADQQDVGSNIAEFAVELTQVLDEMPPGVSISAPPSPLPPLMDLPSNSDVSEPPTAGARSDGYEIIMDIPVTLKVVLGTAKMPVAAISKMARGTVIKLDNKVGDPVDIYANGRFVARGQVVVLDEGAARFGVTLTQVGGLQPIKR